jgi:hypothetical protein
MPIKTIHFDHEGQDVHAELFYNFHNFSNAVLITLLNNVDGLRESIVLLKGKNSWKASADVNNRYPSIVKTIINFLNNELSKEIPNDHIFLLSNFSS